ncbi:MAG: hypothetical protein ACKOHK_11990, partial [Planctomycetia bacterium]
THRLELTLRDAAVGLDYAARATIVGEAASVPWYAIVGEGVWPDRSDAFLVSLPGDRSAQPRDIPVALTVRDGDDAVAFQREIRISPAADRGVAERELQPVGFFQLFDRIERQRGPPRAIDAGELHLACGERLVLRIEHRPGHGGRRGQLRRQVANQQRGLRLSLHPCDRKIDAIGGGGREQADRKQHLGNHGLASPTGFSAGFSACFSAGTSTV